MKANIDDLIESAGKTRLRMERIRDEEIRAQEHVREMVKASRRDSDTVQGMCEEARRTRDWLRTLKY